MTAWNWRSLLVIWTGGLFVALVGVYFKADADDQSMDEAEYEQASPFEDGEEGGANAGGKKRKSKSGQILGRFRGQFLRACKLLHRDGRGMFLHDRLVAELATEDPNCPTCKTLIKIAQAGCKPEKPQRIRVKPGETPPPVATPHPKQRDPHTEVIAAYVDLFEGIARAGLDSEGERAVDKLLAVMADPAGTRAGEREYFSTLLKFIHSARRAAEGEEPGASAPGIAPPTPTEEDLNDLFDR